MNSTQILPKVSIVLPTYNGARYLRRSIESCLSQSYENIELIIVDDCSTDETPDIVRSFNDSRIRYVRNETNQRLPRSLNIGFALAAGEYLTWTSDDNEFLPYAIETMLSVLKEEQTVDFVYSDYTAKYLETGETEVRRFAGVSIKEKNCVGTCFLYTRRVYETIGSFDYRWELVEDYEYWIRVGQKFRLRHIPQLLYIYGEHRKSLKGTRISSINLFDRVLKYHYGFIGLAQLQEQIGRFLTLSVDCRKSARQLADLWAHTLQRILRISLWQGEVFLFYSVYFVFIRTAGYAAKKLLWPARKWLMEQKIKRLVLALKTAEDRINILCAVCDMTMGGSQKVVLTIAQGLKKPDGFCFHLIATRKSDEHLKKAFSAFFKNIIVIDPLPYEDLYLYYYTKLIEALDIDILLISHPVITCKFIPQLKQRFRNLKILDILHLEHVGGTKDELSWLIPHMDRRVCISRRLRDYMAAKYQALGMDNGYVHRLTTIYNGIDLTRYSDNGSLKGRFKAKFQLADNINLISFIGRFSAEKDPFLFVDIARGLLKSRPPVSLKFVMAGDGPLFAQVQKRIREYGLKDHFILPGMLDNGQELLSDTHVFLLTSNHEGIPLAVMEALAMNVPVVSTVVGAVNEVIKDGENGFLISLDNNVVESFCEKILSTLSGDVSYHRLSENARKTVLSTYSLEAMGKGYENIFNEVLDQRHKNSADAEHTAKTV